MKRARALLALTLLASAVATSGCPAFYAHPLPDPPRDATFADLDGTHVRYLDTAAAPGAPERGVVVLIHGFGASLNEWQGVIPALTAAGWRTIALDLRGHGWSSRPDGDYSLDGQAALVVALLDRLGVDRFALVGHSWGSAVALDVAVHVPARVGPIALYNGMFYAAQEPVVFAWARVPALGEIIYGTFYRERVDEKMAFAFYDPTAFISEDLIEKADAVFDRPGTAAAALATIRALDYAALAPHYRTLAQPVLLLWGREDEVTPIEWGERLQNELPDARLVVFPRCGHLPMIEAATPSTRELIDFLAGARATAAGEASR